MAPTSSPTLTHSPGQPSGRYLHHLRREGLNFPRHPPRRHTPSRTEMFVARTPDATSQPSVVFESPPPPPIVPTSSGSAVLAPEPSAIPISNQPPELNQFADIPGNIAAAVVVIVLILGGLIGLVVRGETLRRQMKGVERRVSPTSSECFGDRKSRPTEKATISPQSTTEHETFPYDEKTLTPLMRPLPALHRERRRGLSDVWPIRSLSWAMYDRRSCPEVEPSFPHAPQTTWSEFSPASLHVTPARAVLAPIPEEREDRQGQTNGDFAVMLGATLRQSPESGPVGSTARTKNPTSSDNRLPESLVAAKGRCSEGCRNVWNTGETDEDTKSLGSSAPDMTMDEGESSRSSTASLESLEDGHDRDSLREEVFEVRRAHTRSMQMNKGVLLSLSMKTLNDGQDEGGMHVECSPSHSPSVAGYIERELSLTLLGGNLSAVDLDEFPSPPSMLPIIPSFVSGF